MILSIAQREALDLLRSGKRLVLSPDLPEVPKRDTAVDDDAEEILAALSRLPVHEQHVILPRCFDSSETKRM